MPTPTSGMRSSLPRNRSRFRNSRRRSPRPAEDVVQLVDDQDPDPGRPQQRQRDLLQLGQPLPGPQRCPGRGQQGGVEPAHRRVRTASAPPAPGSPPGPGARRGGCVAAELLDDHRLAVVRRPDQQQVRHPLPGRPGEQRLQPVQRLGGAGVADPPVRAHVPQPLRGRQPRDLLRRRGAGATGPSAPGPSPLLDHLERPLPRRRRRCHRAAARRPARRWTRRRRGGAAFRGRGGPCGSSPRRCR